MLVSESCQTSCNLGQYRLGVRLGGGAGRNGLSTAVSTFLKRLTEDKVQTPGTGAASSDGHRVSLCLRGTVDDVYTACAEVARDMGLRHVRTSLPTLEFWDRFAPFGPSVRLVVHVAENDGATTVSLTGWASRRGVSAARAERLVNAFAERLTRELASPSTTKEQKRKRRCRRAAIGLLTAVGWAPIVLTVPLVVAGSWGIAYRRESGGAWPYVALACLAMCGLGAFLARQRLTGTGSRRDGIAGALSAVVSLGAIAFTVAVALGWL
jgi:hypothetical protein